jgi:outer membrane protein TolC
MHVRVLVSLAACIAVTAWAQVTVSPPERRSISLRDCLELALKHNLDLQVENLAADIAGYNVRGAYGAYVPLFSFEARHDFVSQPGNFDPQKLNPDFPYELNADTLGPSLSGKLPMGFSYDVSAFTREDNARTDFSRSANPDDVLAFPGGIRTTNNYFSDAHIDLRQHLLKDFWIDSDRQTLLIRRKELSMSQQAVRFQVMKTALAVELAYYDLAAARERVRVEEKAVELRQQLVNETRRRVQVGDLPPLDSEQAETQLQNSLTSLSAAREVYAVQQNLLKALLTDDFRQWLDIEISPSDPLLAMQAEVNRSASFQTAVTNRPDLIEARLAVEKSAVVVQYRKNQLLPSLDLLGRYGGLGVATDAGSSINNTFSFDNPQYFYGAVVSFPLSTIAERANYRASKAARQMADLQLKKAEQEVLLQVADLVSRVQSRFDQVNSTRKARTYAEAALGAEQKKLQNGLSTSFIVLQLQETLTLARTAELQALADYNKTQAQLAFAEGSILDKHHLVVGATK